MDKKKNEFDFGDLKTIEIPVVGPDGKAYVLIEASGDATARLNTARTQCMDLDDGKVTGVKGVGTIEMLFISLCLFTVREDGEADRNKAVTHSVLRAWPGRVITALFNKAKEISEIDQDDDLESLRKQYKGLGERIAEMEEDAAKNEPTSMETGLS